MEKRDYDDPDHHYLSKEEEANKHNRRNSDSADSSSDGAYDNISDILLDPKKIK